MKHFNATYWNHSSKQDVTKQFIAETWNEAQAMAFEQDAKARAEKGDFNGQLSLVSVIEIDTPIYDLELTTRTANMLRIAGYDTLEQLERDSLPAIESKLIAKYGRSVRLAMLEIKDVLIPEYSVQEFDAAELDNPPLLIMC
jgi:DNA-directed RNA polymerase alpha subunit